LKTSRKSSEDVGSSPSLAAGLLAWSWPGSSKALERASEGYGPIRHLLVVGLDGTVSAIS